MPLSNVFDIAGSALGAQSIRLNTVASNLANAETVSSNPQQVYRARHPVFSTVLENVKGTSGPGAGGVKVLGVVESTDAPQVIYNPGHPQADKKGYIYMPSVNMVEQMANMISASRSFQSNVEVMNTAKQLMMRTLSLGQ